MGQCEILRLKDILNSEKDRKWLEFEWKPKEITSENERIEAKESEMKRSAL